MSHFNGTMNRNQSEEDLFGTPFMILNTVYPPFLIVSGLICNILVVCVMRTRFFQRQNISVYMTALALNDASSLCISMTSHWLYVSFDNIYDREKTADICKFLQLYGWGNCDFSILLSTTMSVNRAIAVSLPLETRSKYSSRKPKFVIFFLFLVVLIKNIHFVFSSKIVKMEYMRDKLCDVYPESESYRIFWEDVWPWLHVSFLVLCFFVIASSNGVLIRQLYVSSHLEIRRHQCSTRRESLLFTSGDMRSPLKHRNSCFCSEHSNGSGDSKQWQTITPMLIGESVLILLLTFPFSIQLAISNANAGHSQMLFSITFYMLYTNKCATFFVYLITGSRFRLGLKKIFYRCMHGKGAMRRRQFKETLHWINSLSEGLVYG
ncbi:uncharacterized protein LOC125653796 [Ostrea edulis]|uniref:uncharacterized protein LOC125653796 n=1 Tax=Ostrea edulis TaxID=37623 RepID=UPI002096336F|nr:uncharacterized protein LOC125653796 [Ostrea edulis]XP_048739367.1 uncharacterized protein LOC125653796 [Ostrea edulis]XP_048739368.1 uncharacterized protein LOC125653796 [Ostrea edulis]XP_056001174.1 uncharacterized protein LOC125653796 [Ostrea edulis]XP_056001175.1 uncharacterized protein LOC125653796 [Ostrea edulis]